MAGLREHGWQRHQHDGDEGATPSSAFVFGAVAVLALWTVFAILGATGTHDIAAGAETLPRLLNWTAATLAAVATAVCIMRWRLVHDRSAAFVAAGLFLYGAVKVGMSDVLVDASRRIPLVSSASSTARALAITFFVLPLVPWLRRRSPSPQVLLVVSVLGLAAGTLVMLAVPDLGDTLADPSLAESSPTTLASHLALAGVWGVLAVGYVRAAYARESQLDMWMGVAFVALLQSRLSLALVPDGSMWLVASGGFRVLGMLFAFLGCNEGLRAAFVEQREQLRES